MDPLSFLSDAPAGAEAPAVEPPQAAPSDAPVRGPDGRFASAPAPEPQPDPTPPPTPVVQPEAKVEAPPGYVPVAALKELRDEIRGLKNPSPPPTDAEPPAYIDPEVQKELLNTRLNMSEELTRSNYGDEKVDAAKEWGVKRFEQNPAYQAEVLADRNPYRRLVEDHKRHLAVETFGALDPAQLQAFQAWQAAQPSGQAPAPSAAAPAVAIPAPPTPPASLASASSAGGPAVVPTGPGQAYDTLFQR